MKKLLLSFVSAFLLFTLSAQVTENFSDYTVGGKLAQQAQTMGRDYWTTWSNAPGGNEDGVIAEQPAGNKCVKLIAPNNDQILRLGTKNGTTWDAKTTGAWELTFKIFIPTGKDGYFNVKSVFPSTVSETWAMQVYMGTDEGDPGPATPGVGKIYGGSENGVNFNFSHDTWVPIKVFIDLDDDVAEFYVNNNLVHTYQYSLGSFGQSNHRFIAAMNIFPPNTAATSEFYVDDIVFESASGPTVLYQTGFDDMSADYVAQSDPAWWTTWENNPGTTEDALITTEQFASPTKSAKLDWGTDLLFLAGDKTSGIYTIDFDMYIPDAKPAYFNLLHFFSSGNGGQDSEWAVGVYFNIPPSLSSMPPGTNVRTNNILTPFTFPSNTWVPIHFYIDLDSDEASITINNNELVTWQFSTQESGGAGTLQLGRVDLYPPSAASVYYIDNFVYTALSEVETFPIMNVTPDAIDETVDPGENVTKIVTVENTGTSIGEYYSWIEFDLEEPPVGSNDFTLAYCTDIHNDYGLAFALEGYCELGVKFSGTDICDKIGSYITKMSYYLDDMVDNNNTLTFRIYEGAGVNSSGELLAEFTKSNAIIGTWNEVTLPEPVLITGDLWLSVSYIQLPVGGSIYPIGHDNSPQKTGVNWFKRDSEGSSWTKFWEGDPATPYGNIMVKAKAEGGTIPACWVSLTGETYGTVAKNSSKNFNVVLNATGLATGIYSANINVSTSDELHPLFVIPCTITVGDIPYITVTPTSIEHELSIKAQDKVITTPLTVLNEGTAEGEYEAECSDVVWLTLEGDFEGVLPAGESKIFNAVIDATELEIGEYTADITVSTTNLVNPTITIPCKLKVKVDGVETYIDGLQTKIYPNPTSTTVTIESNTTINTIQLINNIGQVVYSTNVNGDHTTINTSNFSAGFYFIKVNTDKGSQSVKVIVK